MSIKIGVRLDVDSKSGLMMHTVHRTLGHDCERSAVDLGSSIRSLLFMGPTCGTFYTKLYMSYYAIGYFC